MFAAVEALIVTKSDYLPLNPDFDMEALKSQAAVLNPGIKVFMTNARTGDGIFELAEWVVRRRSTEMAGTE